MVVQGSPFRLSGPARPEDLIGRHDLLAMLRDRAAIGSFVVLTAPRRFGKTTLVHRLRADAAETGDLIVVLVDLMGVQTLDDVAVRFARAWTRLPRGPLSRIASAVLPYVGGLSIAGGMVQLTTGPGSTSGAVTLEAVLDVPRAVAERSGTRVLVVLDEFQEIAGVDRADAVIRSQIQHHTDTVSYLFSGSDQSTMDLLFADRARPLYGQAEQLSLPAFDPIDLADHLHERMADTGRSITDDALTAYLAFVEGHPQRSMLVADCLWGAVDDGGTVDRPELDVAIDDALVRCRSEFEHLNDFLSDPQFRVLRLLAWAEPITGAAAKRLLVSQGSARASVKALLAKGLVHRDDDRYRVLDPILARWMRGLGPRP
ncbi:ATP-binding protein [soil metagenome]